MILKVIKICIKNILKIPNKTKLVYSLKQNVFRAIHKFVKLI